MNFSKLFIIRPVMTTLVMAAMVIFGIISFFTLPVTDLPAIDYPSITVSASVPGANAETMASAVATPLEKQFSTIAGLDSINSTSALGTSTITLQFNLDRKIDGAAQDVQSAIIAARPFLPANMPTPPTFRKVNPGDIPILFIALSSKTLPLYTVDEYAENIIAQRISMVSGVAQVMVFGSQIYAPHVQVDPRKLASYGIGIDQVATAVQQANVNLPCGTLYGPDTAYNIMANGQLFNAQAFAPLIVTYKDGSPIRLQDIGRVVDSVQTDKVASWYNGNRAVVLAVQRQPGTNTIQIVDSIKKMMPTFRAILPDAVNLEILFDRSISIRHSVEDVQRTLVITVGLVILVVMLSLGSASTTVIASWTLPIAILGTFAAMKLFGFTMNTISLMALTLSVGFVVDDAIVVLENIVRHLEKGEPPLMAAVNGSREISFTVISMTISLIAVFIPILLMGGLVGRLFFQFAVTISVAILISGFVSLTLTPMLCSRYLKSFEGDKKSWLHHQSERAFEQLTRAYDWSLKIALNNKPIVLVSFFLMMLATLVLFKVVPKGLMPSEDTGQISATTIAAEGTSFEAMMEKQKVFADIVQKDPNVQGVMSSVGVSGPSPAVNQGRMNIFLKPRAERKIMVDGVIDSLRKKTTGIPGMNLFMQNAGGIRIGGQQTKALYQVSLSGSDTAVLYDTAKKMEQMLKKAPEMVDVNSDLQIKNLEIAVEIDRDKCSKLGISVQTVQSALNSAYAARQVSVIYTPFNQYWVILEVLPEYYNDPSMLKWFRLRTAAGDLIPLDTVAKVSRGAGPLLISHLGQFPSVTLSFNLAPGAALSAAVAKIDEIKRDLIPTGVNCSFQGTAQVFQDSMSNMGILLFIAVMVIYIVLGILYESFIHPLTILSGLPSAGLGALIILLIFKMPLDIYGFLGLIMLIGIVKKNAIMMIDYAVELERNTHIHAQEAIYKACLTRFRPIMMTTMAALLGSVPLALAIGEGSESRQPLGMCIVGGLLVSQVVTLYITPVFYIYLDRLQDGETMKKWRQRLMRGSNK
ncbi:MAG: efflux RND transporter permease subunit [Candidatus Melainabacteria bacterium]|nr:efflux RND transporter permease subunit [Candidatus Melainabacteria bacterium]